MQTRLALVFVLLTAVAPGLVLAKEDAAATRPNVLWITCEDMSPHLGCYGVEAADTPHLDALAAKGTRYTRAFSTSGVCAPSRSCLITGVYPSSIGTQLMRCQGTPPEFVRCYPEYLRDAGYYCTNNSKTDYNLSPRGKVWDESSNKAHWRNRAADQPFFAIFNDTVTHESQIRLRGAAIEKLTAGLEPERRHDPRAADLPPYYPDTPEARRDWTNYLDLITVMDRKAGKLLQELEDEGVADDTIVLFYSDHGVGLPRAKRWLYDSGMQVPLIVYVPEKFQHLAPSQPGEAIDRLVSFVDFAPTLLSLCGVPIPEHMQGVAFLGEQAGPPRGYVYGIRDRMDERYDLIRAVRDHRYKYIRNYHPELPYAQVLNYAELGPTLQSMRKLFAQGELDDTAARFLQPTKPREELYDCEQDPHELRNLVDSPEHQETLARLRQAHRDWVQETIDVGFLPESELRAREQAAGTTIYELVRRDAAAYPLDRILQAIDTAQADAPSLAQLQPFLKDADPAVRYWAVLGVRRAADSTAAAAVLQQVLRDSSSCVRITAATELSRLDQIEAALPTLTAGLSDENPWVRLSAVIALDELGEEARSELPQLEQALQDSNEYVKRIAEHATKVLKTGE